MACYMSYCSHQYLSRGHLHCSLLQTHFCLTGGGKTLASHRCSVGFNTGVCMRNDHVVNKSDRLISSRTINTRTRISVLTRMVLLIVVKYNGACSSNINVLLTILLLVDALKHYPHYTLQERNRTCVCYVKAPIHSWQD